MGIELKYLEKIKQLAKNIEKNVKLMEVCGTHTQVIAQYGIKAVLPENIKLISGPGCPVCVTSQKDIDAVVALAISGIPIATYGDVIRVRGSDMSLAEAKEQGVNVKAVYGIEEIFKLDKKTVFFGIGFETTTPMSSSAVKRGICLYSAHKSFVPAMKALLGNGEMEVDGLISPGHVATITGSDSFRCLKNKKGKNISQVITGFELEDVLIGIIMLLEQILEGRAETENEYKRVVLAEGNLKALKLINEVFELEESEWRGLGSIPDTGFKMREAFKERDAKIVHSSILGRVRSGLVEYSKGCLCGEVIKGNIEPKNCPMFRNKCSPDNPQGPCMVSVEGSCYIAYCQVDF
ncbi:hydrogenase formation protein HypD [Patescibacteria group bacterium]